MAFLGRLRGTGRLPRALTRSEMPLAGDVADEETNASQAPSSRYCRRRNQWSFSRECAVSTGH